jgi:hypothetical protein
LELLLFLATSTTALTAAHTLRWSINYLFPSKMLEEIALIYTGVNTGTERNYLCPGSLGQPGVQKIATTLDFSASIL